MFHTFDLDFDKNRWNSTNTLKVDKNTECSKVWPTVVEHLPNYYKVRGPKPDAFANPGRVEKEKSVFHTFNELADGDLKLKRASNSLKFLIIMNFFCFGYVIQDYSTALLCLTFDVECEKNIII